MNTTKTTDVHFNLMSALILIGSDIDLMTLFKNGNFNTDINMMIALAKGDNLKPSAVKFIQGIFDNVIVKRKEYLQAYQNICNKRENKLPKWYGKNQILMAIEKRGGRKTEKERMMLKVNDLKNIFAKLNRKGIANLLGDANTLTDEECRTIIASITQLENKLKDII